MTGSCVEIHTRVFRRFCANAPTSAIGYSAVFRRVSARKISIILRLLNSSEHNHFPLFTPLSFFEKLILPSFTEEGKNKLCYPPLKHPTPMIMRSPLLSLPRYSPSLLHFPLFPLVPLPFQKNFPSRKGGERYHHHHLPFHHHIPPITNLHSLCF